MSRHKKKHKAGVPRKNTEHLRQMELMLKEAKGRPLGSMATRAQKRPAHYFELSEQEKWVIDQKLGILDWDGSWNT